ncbi:restriction endonuclease subunit S [Anaerococcus cruorum]|uniref:Restriction endonuclease subunit S n=1 Tax=Anaerococcus cruorum TaxID=3115617 RepID=A0ABW9MUU4_9FIRM
MEFKTLKLEDIVKINKSSYKKEWNWNKAYYLDTGNLTKNTINDIVEFDLKVEKLPSRAKRITQKNSILYSTVRPNQEHYGFIEDDFKNLLVSTGFAVIDTNTSKAVSKYIYYYLTQPNITDYLQKIAEDSVSTYPAIKPSDLKELSIKLPRIEIQLIVSSILSNLDKKIETNNKIIENLETQAQAIFKSWFVDFEPFQDGNFVESELGLIPNGWNISNLGRKFNIEYGKNLPTKNLKNYGYPVFGGNGEIGFYSEYLYEKPRIIVSCRGAASGKVGFSKPYSFVTNNSLVFNEIDENYFYYFGELFDFINFENYVTGSAQPQLTIKNVKDIKIIVPTIEVIDRYNRIMKPFIQYKYFLSEQNQTLAQTRDTLLPKLMSGEIDVSNIKIDDEDIDYE